MPHTEWTTGSAQLEDTEQHLLLTESMEPSSTTTTLMMTYTTDKMVLARMVTNLDLDHKIGKSYALS